jgi:endothelin-converting enzyme/putative endopeptidase
LADPHSPDNLRVTGRLVNQPDFAGAFGCKTGNAIVLTNCCRVW